MRDSPKRLVLMIGGNFTETAKVFEESKNLINNNIGKIIIQSSLYRTAPWYPNTQSHSMVASHAPFLNRALITVTTLKPMEVMSALKKIENQLGRLPSEPNGPRLIDIDLLFYEHLIMESEALTIPHPRLHLRRFNLVPLNEIMPWFRHPVYKNTINQLLAECGDDLGVEKMS